jgi:predicted transport protein
MTLFRIDGRKLVPLNEVSFDLEVELQKITEANLQAVFGLEFVASEYNLQDCYLDTLAFNPETKAFEIIEFKKQASMTIMDQGQTYLNLVLNHKEKVLLEYNESKNKNFKLKDIDWSATRIKFVAPNFTRYQIGALYPKIPFELYEVKKYGPDIVGYERIQPLVTSQMGEPISLTGKAGKEIIVNTPEDIIAKTPPLLKDALRAIEERALELGSDVEEQAGESSISFKTKKKTFLQIWSSKDHLTVNFPHGHKLTDSRHLLKGTGKTGRYINISSGDKIAEIEGYIKEAYQNSL